MNVNYFLPPWFLVPWVELNADKELGKGKKEKKIVSIFFTYISLGVYHWFSNFSSLSATSRYTVFIHETETPFLTPSYIATLISCIKAVETPVLIHWLSTIKPELLWAEVSEEWKWMWKWCPVLFLNDTCLLLDPQPLFTPICFSWEMGPKGRFIPILDCLFFLFYLRLKSYIALK